MLEYGSGEVAGLSLPESAFCTRPPHDFTTGGFFRWAANGGFGDGFGVGSAVGLGVGEAVGTTAGLGVGMPGL